MDPRIRIRRICTKISWIRNTGFSSEFFSCQGLDIIVRSWQHLCAGLFLFLAKEQKGEEEEHGRTQALSSHAGQDSRF
jgi:hypothetical protein